MKNLCFRFRDDYYYVNEEGHIKTSKLDTYSKTWIFLGGAKHHWSNRSNVTLKMSFENPSLLEGCLGFDIDHGTIRRWGGLYNGHLPRIRNPHIIDE